jgi:hypothetical protein
MLGAYFLTGLEESSMKYTTVFCVSATMLALSGCGTNQSEVRAHIASWKGQTETAVTSTFGFPQKTIDMSGGSKVYHYEFSKKCSIDFEITAQQVVSDVKPTGSDLGDCPHKLPGGGTY